MTVIVRRIEADDGPLLRTVRLRALQDAPYAFGSTYEREATQTDAEWDERARLGADAVERVTFFAVGDRRDAVVGLVGGYREDPAARDVELVSMWTDPTARRAGVGRLLVAAVIDWARDLGVDAVNLWVTRGNDAAEFLYASMGFVVTGEHQPLPSDPCKDELRMVFRLTA